MKYELSWYVPQSIIYVTVNDQINADQLRLMNDEINDMIDECPSKCVIILDIDGMKAGYQTSDLLRDSLTCMRHDKLDVILTLSANKLNRLIVLMAFSVSNVLTKHFATIDEIKQYLRQRNIALS